MSGRKRKKTRLTDNEVAEIRGDYQYGVEGSGLLALAGKFGVSSTHIARLLSGQHRKLA